MQVKMYIGFAVALLVVQMVVLFLFGQPWICDCGYVKVWEGVVLSGGNSQHLTDWYTFSHIIHGFLFYLVLTYFFPRIPLYARLALAVGIEAAWEIAENTPIVIQHYREQALAQGYTGDTILNSMSDTVMMIIGFLAARRLPLYASVALCVVFELFVLYMIRDNLTLNVLNLIHVFPAISEWQSAGM